MSEEREDDGAQYHRFLRSLDDSQLISHINSLSQLDQPNITIDQDIQAESTQLDAERQLLADINCSFKSLATLSSDPFDDGLDDVLANIPGRRTAFSNELLRVGGTSIDIRNEMVTEPGECNEFEKDRRTVIPVHNEDLSSCDEQVDPKHVSGEEESEEEVILPKHEFGDYATYFHNKHVKQQKADKEYLQWDLERRRYQGGSKEVEMRKPIFDGCVIHVNGHTVPSINEIHRLVILYGGKFVAYLSNKSSATHIICDRLTPRKKIEFKNCRVVRAKWVTDCIERNELLDWAEYRLMLEVEYGQKRLSFTNREEKVDERVQDEEEDEGGRDDPERAQEHDNPAITDSILGDISVGDSDDLDEISSPEIPGEEATNKQKLDETSEKQKIAMDAKNPDFLKHFFANSRLHHLSTWKADLRLKFLRKIALDKKEKESSQPFNINAPSGEKVILHIDFDCFFATASSLNHPNLDINKDPIAVTHGGRTSDIASCNYVARKFGLRNGMWSGKAKLLCPELIQLDYDFDTYERCSGKLYDYLISSEIFDHIFPVLIDEVLLDVTSFCHASERPIVDTVSQVSQKIRKDVFDLTNCSISVGASHNVLLAKLALRKAKPNGQFYLHDNINEFLDKIAVKDLPGIGHSIKHKLLEELKDIPNNEPLISDIKPLSELRLTNTFGMKTGTKLYRYARGLDNTSIELDINNSESILGRKSVSVDVNFGIRFDTVVQVETFLMNLSKELNSRLVSLGMCGSSITLRLAKRAKDAPIDPPKYLGMGLCDFISKSSRLGVPTNDWGIIGSELKALFRMVNVNIPVKELRGVAITMNKLEDVENLKKIRQMRLPFSHLKKTNFNEEVPKPRNQVKGVYCDTLETEHIDWEVFKELPEDIKNELLSELDRRGILTNKPNPSRQGEILLIKEQNSTNSHSRLPGKKNKTYLQQLIPTQFKGTPKYVRVVESPKKSPSKSPRKRQNRSTSPSPVKRQTSMSYNESGSYDDSVLNELPSSLKRAVLKDLEYKKKIKKYDLTTMKDKMEKKYKKKKISNDFKVNEQFISAQPKLINAPLFLNQLSSFVDIRNSMEGWISMSLDQGGPHLEDVRLFTDYLRELLKQGNVSRCMNFIKCLRRDLDCQVSIQNMVNNKQNGDLLVIMAINDWKNVITKHIIPVVNEYCSQNCIESII